MLGNLKGWLLSLVIVALTGVVIFMQGIPPKASAPTGKLAFGLTPLQLPADPEKLVPMGTGDGDAGPLYRKAAEIYRQSSLKFNNYEKETNKDRRKTALDDLNPVVDSLVTPLVEARACKTMVLFAKNPSEIVNYDNAKSVVADLERMQASLVQIAAAQSKSNKKRSTDIAESVFIMGRHLANERVCFAEFNAGTSTMINACSALKFTDAARAGEFDQFVATMSDFNKDKITPVYKSLSQLPREGGMLPEPGDALQLARESKEPLWRVEALLKAGRMARMAGVELGDQIAARKLLKTTADRTDLPPNVKAAAIAARDLDSTTFNKIGGGS